MTMLRTGKPFLSKLSKEEWSARQGQIIKFLKGHPRPTGLDKANSIRFRGDEIGWYLFKYKATSSSPDLDY
jgi:hypothetical protein